MKKIPKKAFKKGKSKYAIRNMVSIKQVNGFYFGSVKIKRKKSHKPKVNFDVVLPTQSCENLVIFGSTGSGKSECIIKPILCETWNEPFLAIDIKGDLQKEYEKKRHDINTKVFSLREKADATYDPFYFLSRDGEENLVSNVRELANALIPMPINSREPFWIQSAQGLLSAAILYYFKLGLSFIEGIINIMTTPPSKLIEEISTKSETMQAKIFINNFIGVENLSDSKMLLGVGQELTNALSIFATDPRITEALSPSENEIRWQDLETDNIFILPPEDRLEQYSGVLSMMITQLIRTLERRPEKHTRQGAKCSPILLMFDEFPRYKLDVITSSISTLRSKKVTIAIVCQSLAQLDAIYGKDIRRIILDNCPYKAILSANDSETQEYFSKLIGDIEIKNHSFSKTYDATGQLSAYGHQVSKKRKSIVFPHELATLKNTILLTPEGYCKIDKVPYYSRNKLK